MGNETERLNLRVVATFPSTADAQVAKGVLDEVGIESMIRSDNAGGMYPALSGADLLVRAEDVEKANEALMHPQSKRPISHVDSPRPTSATSSLPQHADRG